MRDIILELLKLTIMVATLVITRYVVPWIKAKTENEVMSTIIDLVAQAVLAAEQCHQAEPGPERKAIVTKFIKTILEQKNLALSDEELDMMIEAAVKQMNATKEIEATHE
jgi:LL-H family phage holin